MSKTNAPAEECEKFEQYEIRVKGHVSDRWAAWFEGLTIAREENGDTRLTGPVVDQAELYGLLRKVRNLGMPLLSVGRIASDSKIISPPTVAQSQ